MDDVAVSRATPDDLADALAVIRAAFAGYRGVLVPESGALRETAGSLAARLRAGAVFLARDGGAGGAIGAVCAEIRGNDVYLDRLAVAPAARGRGVAAALVAAVEAYAAAAGIARVSLGVRLALTGNQRLFSRLGYRETGHSAHPGFREPTSATYEKKLVAGGG